MAIAEDYYHRHRHHKIHHHRHVEIMSPDPEPKWFDIIGLPITNPTTTPTVVLLNNPVQGVGQNQRIGDQIHCDSQYYRMTMARGTVDAFFRLIFFVWKADDVPTASEILQDPASIVSPLNRDYSKTFHILRDDTFTLANGESQLQIKKDYWPCHLNSKFTSDGSTSLTMNQLYVLFMSDQPTITTAPIINFYHRLTFTDN